MKSKFFIPVIALLIALISVGAVPGMASDTTASIVSTSDELTYVSATVAPTSSLDEEIESIISSAIGDDLKEAEGPLRDFSEIMSKILSKFKEMLNTVIQMITGFGGSFGGSVAG